MDKYRFSFMVSRVKIGETWVLFNWLNTRNISIEDADHPLYQLLENKTKNVAPFTVNGTLDDFEYLIENHFFVTDQNIVRDMVRKQYDLAVSPENLSVILMPVDQACNFRCQYCYEDHTKSQFMDDTDLDVFSAFVSGQDIETLRIDYFGGEPLLNLSFIRKCNARMIEMGEKRGFVVTPSSMTTNGYLLTKDVFLDLHDLRITSYQITVDGDKSNHDLLRPLANGKGSYDVVYRNLLDMASTDRKFSLTLRTNFTPITGAERKRKEFLQKVQGDFGNDKRFILMPEPVSRWAPEEQGDDSIYCAQDEARSIRNTYQLEAEAMGLETLSMVLLCGPESHFCYAAKPNNVIIYPRNKDGCLPIQKCTLDLTRTSNNVGHISPNGGLVKNEHWGGWVPNNLFSTRKCRDCFFVLNCFGNACVHKNQTQGRIICPKEKGQEAFLVQRVLSYIARNQQFAQEEGG